MHDNTIISYIEYGALFIIVVIFFNKLVDSFFATKVETMLEKNEPLPVNEEAQKVEKTTEVVSTPLPQYDVYHPSIFLKKRTRNFYFDLVFNKELFLDEPWLTTLVEILSLLELAIDTKVIKDDKKSIEMIVGTRGINEIKNAQAFNAYDLYELTFEIVEYFVKYYDENDNFREMVLAILLLYIDHVEQIQHWSNGDESVLQSLAQYMSRNLPSENREMIQQFIYNIHNSVDNSEMIEDIQHHIYMVQHNLNMVIKLVKKKANFYTWSKKYINQKMHKSFYSMDEIRQF